MENDSGISWAQVRDWFIDNFYEHEALLLLGLAAFALVWLIRSGVEHSISPVRLGGIILGGVLIVGVKLADSPPVVEEPHRQLNWLVLATAAIVALAGIELVKIGLSTLPGLTILVQAALIVTFASVVGYQQLIGKFDSVRSISTGLVLGGIASYAFLGTSSVSELFAGRRE